MAKVLSTLCALALAVASLSAQSNIAGDWELTINGPEGAITATAALKQDGDNLTGTITSPQGTVELKGTYKAKKVELAFTIASQISGAIENARLFDETRRLLNVTEQRAAELGAVSKVSQALIV